MRFIVCFAGQYFHFILYSLLNCPRFSHGIIFYYLEVNKNVFIVRYNMKHTRQQWQWKLIYKTQSTHFTIVIWKCSCASIVLCVLDRFHHNSNFPFTCVCAPAWKCFHRQIKADLLTPLVRLPSSALWRTLAKMLFLYGKCECHIQLKSSRQSEKVSFCIPNGTLRSGWRAAEYYLMLIDLVMHAALCRSLAPRHNRNARRRRDKVSTAGLFLIWSALGNYLRAVSESAVSLDSGMPPHTPNIYHSPIDFPFASVNAIEMPLAKNTISLSLVAKQVKSVFSSRTLWLLGPRPPSNLFLINAQVAFILCSTPATELFV